MDASRPAPVETWFLPVARAAADSSAASPPGTARGAARGPSSSSSPARGRSAAGRAFH